MAFSMQDFPPLPAAVCPPDHIQVPNSSGELQVTIYFTYSITFKKVFFFVESEEPDKIVFWYFPGRLFHPSQPVLVTSQCCLMK